MAKTHELSPLAQSDYEDILHYIARDNPAAARRIHGEFQTAFGRLAENPYLGHVRDDLTTRPVRFWGLYSYQIIYDPDADPLTIVRILSGYRDIGRLMEVE